MLMCVLAAAAAAVKIVELVEWVSTLAFVRTEHTLYGMHGHGMCLLVD
jgi:hypothetical protein